MTVKLLTEQHLEFLSIKGAALAGGRLHLPKCHIVGNNMSRRLWVLCGVYLTRSFQCCKYILRVCLLQCLKFKRDLGNV